MLFTRLIVRNLYSFDNLDIDFTIRKKPENELIEGEFLENHPHFLVKRLCIFAGANATGKTSIGRIMCSFQNFLVLKTSLRRQSERICNKNSNAVIEAEFVTPRESKFHRCCVVFSNNEPILQGVKYAYIDILKNDTVEKARKRLDRVFESKSNGPKSPLINSFAKNRNRLEQIEKFLSLEFSDISWTYLFSTNRDDSDKSKKKNSPLSISDEKTIFEVLKGFDNTVSGIESLKSGNNEQFEGFKVFFENGDSILILSDGECASQKDADRLSKGTYEAVSVAGFLASMNKQKDISRTFFLDEKMSASHAVMEKEILNIMINILPRNSQLFYTTHNSEVLDMTLPVHSFVLLKKNNSFFTEVIQPENFEMEDTIKEAVMNDVFNTLPDSYEMNDFFLKDI